MKKVLLISHTCQSKTEGQPRAEHLARAADIDLRVLVPSRWKHYGQWRAPQVPANPHYRFLPRNARMAWMGSAQYYLHFYPGLTELLLDFQPDVIDLWEEPWGLVSAHACWLRNRLLPAAKIVSETEQNLNKSLPFPFETFRKYTLRNADYATGRSQGAAEVLRQKGYNGPISVVPNGVDAELFRPFSASERQQCRQEFGLDGFVVGYVGRFVEEKGLTDLLEAVSMCPPDIKLLLVGSGEMEGELAQRIAESGMQDRVWLRPYCEYAALPRLMNAIDLLALPSRTTPRWKEQFGRVIAEAHACRTPVIGSNSGAIPEVIGGGGLIFPEQAPEALAAAIQEMAGDPARCAECGQVGRQNVEQHFTWQRVAERMIAIYDEVLAERSTAEYAESSILLPEPSQA